MALLFAVGGALLLPDLDYFFDEGVAMQQARRVRAGELPYRDFFYHQTPLYPVALAALAAPAPDSVFAHRLPSLLASIGAGLLVFRLAGLLLPGWGALLAMLLFYTAPLQYFGLVAAPNALMLMTATAGVLLVAFGTGRLRVLLGGVVFAVSVLLKPLALPTAAAVGLFLLATRHERWKLGWAMAGGGATLGAAWLVFDWQSGGAFTELLMLQASRHGGAMGFELVRQYPSIGGVAASQGIETLLGWNLRQHLQTFFSSPAGNPNLPLLALALLGQLVVWSPWGRPLAPYRSLLTLWWAVPLLFALLVWDPTWQFYFVQYLPPLAILAGLGAVLAWRGLLARVRHSAGSARLRRLGRAAPACLAVGLAAGMAWAGWQGVASLSERRSDYSLVPRPEPGESWLLFDPFLNFVSGARPACGLIDPFNVYAARSLVAADPEAIRSPHHLDRAELIRCLERDPHIRIGLGYWAQWFVDAPLRAYLAALPDERFVPMRLHYRPSGGSLPDSGERLRR